MFDRESVKKLCEKIPPPDKAAFDRVMKRWDSIAKPIDGLGEFERIVARIGGIQGEEIPKLSDRRLLVFLSDNGIVDEKVTQSDHTVTHSVAEAMAENGSTVCVMARQAAVKVVPVDIGMKGEAVSGIIYRRIKEGTGDFYIQPAMTEEETLRAMEIGCEMADMLHEDGCEVLLLGEMGIGNTSTATAVGCAILDLSVRDHIGRGAGLSDEGFLHKQRIIEEAVKKADFDRDDVIGVLSRFGGFDIAGMTGAILEAASLGMPVILDGLITLSALLVAERLCPNAADYCIASHVPGEPMGAAIMSELSLKAPINAVLALGEGTGGVLLMSLLDVCVRLLREGRRFEGLGIESYKRKK